MKPFTQKTTLTASLLSLSSVALAHPGHALAPSASVINAVIAGLMHPVSGLDHMVLAVGMGILFANAKKVGIGLLMLGLVSGFALVQYFNVGMSQSIIEAAILASVILTAVAVLAQRTQVAKTYQKGFSAFIAISLFGLTLFHGMAHAVEMPMGSVREGFAVGMLAVMAALFAMGASLMISVKNNVQSRMIGWLPSALVAIGATMAMFNA